MRIQLHTIVMSSGERLPVLTDESGVPLHFPLVFSIRDRQRGGVARLKQRLRRIRDLYLAFRRLSIDLDQAILNRNLDLQSIETALFWLEEEHEDSSSSPGLRNRRIMAWSDFLAWAIETSHWTLRTNPLHADKERDAAGRLRIMLEDHQLPVSVSREVHPLATREVEVLNDVLGPGTSGGYERSPFGAETAERAWILYLLLRWGGLRLGEALKLKLEDLPPRETEAEAILREIENSALAIHVRRRIDDVSDTRVNEPSVKRLSRRVPLPDALVQLLWKQLDRAPTADSYLIRTDDRVRPLSYSQASKLTYEIRKAAIVLFEERYPGDPHTLAQFRWHRLRHTRAVEMLPRYFPDGHIDPVRQRRFCDAFGWARLETAEPYLRLLHRQEGEAIWRRSLNQLEP